MYFEAVWNSLNFKHFSIDIGLFRDNRSLRFYASTAVGAFFISAKENNMTKIIKKLFLLFTALLILTSFVSCSPKTTYETDVGTYIFEKRADRFIYSSVDASFSNGAYSSTVYSEKEKFDSPVEWAEMEVEIKPKQYIHKGNQTLKKYTFVDCFVTLKLKVNDQVKYETVYLNTDGTATHKVKFEFPATYEVKFSIGYEDMGGAVVASAYKGAQFEYNGYKYTISEYDPSVCYMQELSLWKRIFASKELHIYRNPETGAASTLYCPPSLGYFREDGKPMNGTKILYFEGDYNVSDFVGHNSCVFEFLNSYFPNIEAVVISSLSHDGADDTTLIFNGPEDGGVTVYIGNCTESERKAIKNQSYFVNDVLDISELPDKYK